MCWLRGACRRGCLPTGARAGRARAACRSPWPHAFSSGRHPLEGEKVCLAPGLVPSSARPLEEPGRAARLPLCSWGRTNGPRTTKTGWFSCTFGTASVPLGRGSAGGREVAVTICGRRPKRERWLEAGAPAPPRGLRLLRRCGSTRLLKRATRALQGQQHAAGNRWAAERAPSHTPRSSA